MRFCVAFQVFTVDNVPGLFISYGARDEIVRAARSLARDAAAGRLDP